MTRFGGIASPSKSASGVASTTSTLSTSPLPQSSKATTPIQYTVPSIRRLSPNESMMIDVVSQLSVYPAIGQPSTVEGGCQPDAGKAYTA